MKRRCRASSENPGGRSKWDIPPKKKGDLTTMRKFLKDISRIEKTAPQQVMMNLVDAMKERNLVSSTPWMRKNAVDLYGSQDKRLDHPLFDSQYDADRMKFQFLTGKWHPNVDCLEN